MTNSRPNQMVAISFHETLEQVLAGNPETARPLPDLAALSS